MRKIYCILCVLALFACVSCSNESEEKESDSIVGNWVSYYAKFINVETGEVIDERPWHTHEMRFYDDGTCVYNRLRGTYKTMGENLDIFTESLTVNYNIVERSNNKMIVSRDEYVYYDYRTAYYYMERKD